MYAAGERKGREEESASEWNTRIYTCMIYDILLYRLSRFFSTGTDEGAEGGRIWPRAGSLVCIFATAQAGGGYTSCIRGDASATRCTHTVHPSVSYRRHARRCCTCVVEENGWKRATLYIRGRFSLSPFPFFAGSIEDSYGRNSRFDSSSEFASLESATWQLLAYCKSFSLRLSLLRFIHPVLLPRRTRIPRNSPYSQYQNVLVEIYNNRQDRKNDTFINLDWKLLLVDSSTHLDVIY